MGIDFSVFDRDADLTANSKRQYVGQLRRFKENGGDIFRPQTVIELNDKRGALSGAVLAYLKRLKPARENLVDRYKAIHSEVTERLKRERNRNSRNQRELDNWVSLKDLIRFRASLYRRRNESRFVYEMWLWLTLEIKVSPLRLEYLSLVANSGTENSLDKKSKEIIIRHHKSQKSFGKDVVIGIPEPVYKILETYTKKFKIEAGDNLFQHRNHNAFHNRLSDESKNFFGGKIVGAQIIRKVLISHWFKKKRSLEEVEEHAWKSLHSAQEHRRYEKILK